jgi:hypothetical protein
MQIQFKNSILSKNINLNSDLDKFLDENDQSADTSSTIQTDMKRLSIHQIQRI